MRSSKYKYGLSLLMHRILSFTVHSLWSCSLQLCREVITQRSHRIQINKMNEITELSQVQEQKYSRNPEQKEVHKGVWCYQSYTKECLAIQRKSLRGKWSKICRGKLLFIVYLEIVCRDNSASLPRQIQFPFRLLMDLKQIYSVAQMYLVDS